MIEVDGVSKSYPWNRLRARTLKEALVSRFAPKSGQVRTFEALKDVSFKVLKGETVGILGSNGSGKSTVLKLITGIIKPTSGKVCVTGRMSALLELGAGFHPDFSGRENVFLNGSILGIPRKDLEAAFDRIVEFAEIAEFIDQPVKTYSSGMYTRLAFAIAVNIDPDILVIDEVLAVGDYSFQQKCFEQLKRFREAGKTILIVTHDHATVRSICDRAIWIERGVKRMDGPTDEVVDAYVASQMGELKLEREIGADGEPIPVLLESLDVLGANGRVLDVLGESEPFTVKFSWTANRDITVKWAFTLRRMNDGFVCGGNLSAPMKLEVGAKGGASFTVSAMTFAEGAYEIIIEAMANGEFIPGSGRAVLFGTQTSWQGPGACHVDGAWEYNVALQRSASL